MPPVRINGIKLDLQKMSNGALDALMSTINARQRRAFRDADAVRAEIGRRAHEGQDSLDFG